MRLFPTTRQKPHPSKFGPSSLFALTEFGAAPHFSADPSFPAPRFFVIPLCNSASGRHQISTRCHPLTRPPSLLTTACQKPRPAQPPASSESGNFRSSSSCPPPRPPKKGSRKERGSFHFGILFPCISIPISGFDTAHPPSPTFFILGFFRFFKLLLFFRLQQLLGRLWALNVAKTLCLQNSLSVQLTLASTRQRAHRGGRLASPNICAGRTEVCHAVRQYVSNRGTCTHEAGT